MNQSNDPLFGDKFTDSQFTEMFKREAVQLHLLSRKSHSQIEQKLGLANGLLICWREELAQLDRSRPSLNSPPVDHNADDMPQR